jgi:hypothetical protein
MAKKSRKQKKDTGKGENKFTHFIHNVEKGVKKVVHDVEKIAKPIIKKIGEVANKVIDTGESLLGSVTNIGKGVGDVAGSFKYIPYIVAGLAGLLIVNASGVGKGIGDAGAGIAKARGM